MRDKWNNGRFVLAGEVRLGDGAQDVYRTWYDNVLGVRHRIFGAFTFDHYYETSCLGCEGKGSCGRCGGVGDEFRYESSRELTPCVNCDRGRCVMCAGTGVMPVPTELNEG